MTPGDTIARLLGARVVVILRGLTIFQVEVVVDGLRRGGIEAVEVTLDSPDSLEAIGYLGSNFPDVLVGAGTARTAGDVAAAAAAGAAFVVSPHFDPAVVDATRHAGLVAVPGAMTPTEILRAQAAGADFVKVFPIASLGGAAYVEQLRGPIPNGHLMVTGGVDAALGRACLSGGAQFVGVGLQLILGGVPIDDGAGIQRATRAFAAELFAERHKGAVC